MIPGLVHLQLSHEALARLSAPEKDVALPSLRHAERSAAGDGDWVDTNAE